MIKNVRMIPRGFIHSNLFTIEGFFMSKIQLPVIDTKTALLTAGVMLGMSAGMMINHNVHADTVNPSTSVMTVNNNNNNNENNTPSQVNAAQSDTANTTQTQAEKTQAGNKTDTASATSNTSNDQVVTENHAMTATTNDDQQQAHKINFSFVFPDGGSKVPLETYPNVANDISQYNNIKTGSKYDLSDWKLSAFPEFDFVGLKNADTGKNISYTGTMPDHDLNVQVVVQPTGDGRLKSMDFKDMDPVMQACYLYIETHGLPSHLDHQAYGGKTEDEFNNMADGTKDKNNQGTQDGKDPNRDVINNQKHVTLKFNVLYNGKIYGTETIKDAIVGNPYTLTSIPSLQNKLLEKGLTLNSASLKLLSGTVPDKDTTYNLQVVKADNAGNETTGSDTVRNTTKSVPDSNTNADKSGGQDNWQSADGTETPASDSTNTSESADTQADTQADPDDQNGNDQNMQNSDPNKQQNTESSTQNNANNQQLPQTGNVRNTVALVALGLSCMGIGTALLLKRE